MKKFKFKLQVVLDHRKRIENEKKKELGKVNAVLNSEKDKFYAFENVYLATQLELKKKETGILDIAQMLFYQSYLIQLRQIMQHQKKVINEVLKEVEKKRLELVEVSKKRKVLDKLKEKEYSQYTKEMALVEQKFIDEISINKYLRDGNFNLKQLED